MSTIRIEVVIHDGSLGIPKGTFLVRMNGKLVANTFQKFILREFLRIIKMTCDESGVTYEIKGEHYADH